MESAGSGGASCRVQAPALLGGIDMRSLDYERKSRRFAESERGVVSLVNLEKDGMASVVFLPRYDQRELNGKQ